MQNFIKSFAYITKDELNFFSLIKIFNNLMINFKELVDCRVTRSKSRLKFSNYVVFLSKDR